MADSPYPNRLSSKPLRFSSRRRSRGGSRVTRGKRSLARKSTAALYRVKM
ncbi:hypothetical protein GA0061094_0844 [[Bacillus] enclensis]|uniref:Uncharacterized protein n=1 Tax=[Bacillus] enclensis TaxID=1402860 RepID=A0A1C3ZMS9_9BACI|nr:hypothetical protein GA0061094_0844 [[Bacillus] enclensis]